jgi:hypothetical protein
MVTAHLLLHQQAEGPMYIPIAVVVLLVIVALVYFL